MQTHTTFQQSGHAGGLRWQWQPYQHMPFRACCTLTPCFGTQGILVDSIGRSSLTSKPHSNACCTPTSCFSSQGMLVDFVGRRSPTSDPLPTRGEPPHHAPAVRASWWTFLAVAALPANPIPVCGALPHHASAARAAEQAARLLTCCTALSRWVETLSALRVRDGTREISRDAS